MKKTLLMACLIVSFCLPVFSEEVNQQEEFIFKGELVLGSIEKVDLKKNEVSIKSNSGETIKLLIDKKETIIWIDDNEKELPSVKPGYDLEAKYRINEKNQKVASWLDITTETNDLALSDKEKKENLKEKETAPNQKMPKETKEEEKKA